MMAGRCWDCSLKKLDICNHVRVETRDLRLAPAIANRTWKWRSKVTEAYKLPQTPILSIIVLNLKEGLDITDPSQPASRFWAATIEYLKTLPDWRSMSWGTDLNDPCSIILLIQWASGSAWQIFQNSFGVGHMADLLANPPLNRCAQLDTSGLGAKGRVLKLVSFTFDAKIDSETAAEFHQRWKSLIAMVMKHHEVDGYGQWLERDVPFAPYVSEFDCMNLEAYEEADRQPAYFVSLLSWNKDAYTADLSSAEEYVTSLALHATQSLERIVVRPMSDVVSWHPPSQSHKTAVQSTEDLFQVPLERRYIEDNGINAYDIDRHAIASTRDVIEGKRLYPAPYGSYVRMGQINQYQPTSKSKSSSSMWITSSPDNPPPDTFTPTDICWLKFKSRGEKSDAFVTAKKVLFDLMTNIRAHEGCFAVHCGRDEERNGRYAILVTWKSCTLRASSWNQFESCFQAFAASETIDFESLETQNFASKNALGYLSYGSHFEVVSFYIPANDKHKSLFERSHDNYMRQVKLCACQKENLLTVLSTMKLGHAAYNNELACSARYSGWQSDAETRNGIKTFRFTSLIAWIDCKRGSAFAARNEWYGDFAEGMRSYDRLGHQIDALRMLAVAGVESQFIALMD